MAFVSRDPHRLVHYPQTQGLSETVSGDAVVLFESSSDKLPFGWLFLFGSRNIWEPGESVSNRGGEAGRRDPTVTPMEVAQVRLHEAVSVLRRDTRLGPPFAPLGMLEQALEAAGNRGQLRLESQQSAPGKEQGTEEKRRRFLENVAVAENVVFHLGQKNLEQAGRALAVLNAYCPFVPAGEPAQDLKALQKAVKRLDGSYSVEEGAVRLLVGWPVPGRMKTLFSSQAPSILKDLKEQAQTAAPSKPWWAFWK